MFQDHPIKQILTDTCIEEMPNIVYQSREEAGEK